MAFIVIQDWMVEELNLSGNQLLVFALINTCTQNGEGCWYAGYDSMAKRIGCSQRSVISTINSLIELKYIEKSEGIINGKVRNILKTSYEKFSCEKFSYEKISEQGVKNFHDPLVLSTNIINTTSDNKLKKEKNIKKSSLSLPFSSERFIALWDTLCQSPKWKTKPTSALELSLKKLAKYDEEFACLLIEESIEHNWTGVVFPAKNGYGGTDAQYVEWQKNNQKCEKKEEFPDGTYWLKDFSEAQLQSLFELDIRRKIKQGFSIRRKNGEWMI